MSGSSSRGSSSSGNNEEGIEALQQRDNEELTQIKLMLQKEQSERVSERSEFALQKETSEREMKEKISELMLQHERMLQAERKGNAIEVKKLHDGIRSRRRIKRRRVLRLSEASLLLARKKRRRIMKNFRDWLISPRLFSDHL
jgi:hypothetical protein